ncbi:hypothetical protein A3Q56_06389 [Intoshia linei]|uniref:RRM domain-containing protein n=1 Tax=Intoshia linei TaxID=1819745 RepID=A0A177AX06_9BILA|nr:hypothetical protein A3Q56_06389 [Intoshia linei]
METNSNAEVSEIKNTIGEVILNKTNDTSSEAINSRLFLGGIDTEAMTSEDVLKTFSSYGQVKGITLLKGYGFVQMSNAEQALHAFEDMKGKSINGSTIDVKLMNKQKLNKDVEIGEDVKAMVVNLHVAIISTNRSLRKYSDYVNSQIIQLGLKSHYFKTSSERDTKNHLDLFSEANISFTIILFEKNKEHNSVHLKDNVGGLEYKHFPLNNALSVIKNYFNNKQMMNLYGGDSNSNFGGMTPDSSTLVCLNLLIAGKELSREQFKLISNYIDKRISNISIQPAASNMNQFMNMLMMINQQNKTPTYPTPAPYVNNISQMTTPYARMNTGNNSDATGRSNYVPNQNPRSNFSTTASKNSYDSRSFYSSLVGYPTTYNYGYQSNNKNI